MIPLSLAVSIILDYFGPDASRERGASAQAASGLWLEDLFRLLKVRTSGFGSRSARVKRVWRSAARSLTLQFLGLLAGTRPI
jgi:hypothetical protein